MKTLTKTIATFAAVAIVFAGVFGTPQKAQAQPSADQIAIYLGALTLGYSTNISTLTPQQQAEALFNGRGLLRSNVQKTQPLIQGQPTSVNVQSTQFQSLLLQAANLASTTPITLNISGVSVNLNNGKSALVNARMDSTRIRPSQIFDFIARRIPQFTPALTQDFVSAVFLEDTNNVPLYNFRGQTQAQIFSAMLADASRIGQSAMRTGMGNYPRGTTNVPAAQLLDFRPNQPSTQLISKFTAAISARAFMGLPNSDDIIVDTFRYDQAAASLVTGLVRGANAYTRRNPFSAPAAVAGSIYSVTGLNNTAWSYLNPTVQQTTITAALNGIVFGASRAARNLAPQIGYYAAAAFAATFVANGGNQTLLVDGNITSGIANAIEFALGSRAWLKVQTSVQTQIANGLADGRILANIPNIGGALGVNNFQYVGASPAPVTDITGS
jgi:hypothetical protein